MTLGTFPSMAPYQKSCWHSLYFNCRQVKLDPQKPLFFIAFWVWDNRILIYCSQTNCDRWNLMPACNWACLGLKWVTLRLVQIWPPTWSSMHAKFSHREMSKFQFSKSRQKKTHYDLPVSIPFQWSPIFCSTIMQKFSLETSRTTKLGWSEVCY